MPEEYLHLLKFHDWYYQYSDDQRIWEAGQKERNQLEKMQRQHDPDYLEWNKYCPAQFRININHERKSHA